jgi:uncharacterized protein YjiS (DUF1127 family)
MKANIMQVTPQTPTFAAFADENSHTSSTPILLRALNWLAARDRRYRDAQKLRHMPDERLLDMGLTRMQANQVLYRSGRERADAKFSLRH